MDNFLATAFGAAFGACLWAFAVFLIPDMYHSIMTELELSPRSITFFAAVILGGLLPHLLYWRSTLKVNRDASANEG